MDEIRLRGSDLKLAAVLIGGVAAGIIKLSLMWKQKRVAAALREIAAREPHWTEEKLLAVAKTHFLDFQSAWSKQDFSGIEKYIHPSFLVQWRSHLKEPLSFGARRSLSSVVFLDSRVVDLRNFKDNQKDGFTVCFDVSATHHPLGSGNPADGNNIDTQEFWSFQWDQDRWKLTRIATPDDWEHFVKAPIIDESE